MTYWTAGTAGTATVDVDTHYVDVDPERALALCRRAASWYEDYLAEKHPGVRFSVRVIEHERDDIPVDTAPRDTLDGRVSDPDDVDPAV